MSGVVLVLVVAVLVVGVVVVVGVAVCSHGDACRTVVRPSALGQ